MKRLVAAILVAMLAAVPASAENTDARDELIAAQENLLNAYRCMFSIDMGLVPGGCDPHRPEPVVPVLGVSGTGQGVRHATLSPGRYLVGFEISPLPDAIVLNPDGSEAGPDARHYFSVKLHDANGQCGLLAGEIVPLRWSSIKVLSTRGCDTADLLLIDVYASEGIAWEVTFTAR